MTAGEYALRSKFSSKTLSLRAAFENGFSQLGLIKTRFQQRPEAVILVGTGVTISICHLILQLTNYPPAPS